MSSGAHKVSLMSLLGGLYGEAARLEVKVGYCMQSVCLPRQLELEVGYPASFDCLAICQRLNVEVFTDPDSRSIVMRNGHHLRLAMADDDKAFNDMVNRAIMRVEDVAGPMVYQ